ncbi:MAG: phage major capsid protein, partial [Mesorhizobium sp.]
MPELKDVLEDVQREVKKFGDDVGTLKTSMEKDLKAVRDLAEKAGTDAAAGTQLKKDLDNLSRGVEEKHAAIEAKVKEIMEKAQKEAEAIIAIEKKLGRPGAGVGDQESVLKHATEFKRVAMSRRGELKLTTSLNPEDVNVDEYKAYQNAFKMSLRREINQLTADEQKAMMVGSDPDGGYLVPTQTSSRIVTKVYETSPIDELAYHE